MTTTHELNRAICKGLGWTEVEWEPDPRLKYWAIPSDQPWHNDWHGSSSTSKTRPTCPDFIRDPAEAWRLMVHGCGQIRYDHGLGFWIAAFPKDSGGRLPGPLIYANNSDPALAVGLAFLASKGVQATPPEDA